MANYGAIFVPALKRSFKYSYVHFHNLSYCDSQFLTSGVLSFTENYFCEGRAVTNVLLK